MRGASTRYFDKAFVDAGLGAGRLEQTNMIGNNNRSLFDSWTTTIRGRTGRVTASASYILASSRSWGGQPVGDRAGEAVDVLPCAIGQMRRQAEHQIPRHRILNRRRRHTGRPFHWIGRPSVAITIAFSATT